MDLKGIMLGEVRKTEKTNIAGYHLLVESKKYNRPVNITEKKEDHRGGEQN